MLPFEIPHTKKSTLVITSGWYAFPIQIDPFVLQMKELLRKNGYFSIQIKCKADALHKFNELYKFHYNNYHGKQLKSISLEKY